MTERLAERTSWKTWAGEQKQSLAAAVRCLPDDGQNGEPREAEPGFLLDTQVRAGDRGTASGTLLLLIASSNFNVAIWAETVLNTGQAMLVIVFAEPCAHISRLFENIGLGICHISTEMKRTQTVIGTGLLQLCPKISEIQPTEETQRTTLKS